MARPNISKDIKKSGLVIKDTMQLNLAKIADDMINQIMNKYAKLTKSTELNSIKDIKVRGTNIYKQEMLATMATLSLDAIDQARSEIPAAKNIKLMENEERLLFGEFERLPKSIQKRLTNANQLLIGTQIGDLEKAIFFQFTSSANSTDSAIEIKSDIQDKADDYITGPAISSGSVVTAANVVNESRNAFFFKDDVLKEIEAFEFMNGDPVSLICNDLAGLIYSKNDPNAFKYTAPLHYGCKSWNRPILVGQLKKTTGRNGKKGDDAIEKFEPSTAKIAKTVQFNERVSCSCC